MRETETASPRRNPPERVLIESYAAGDIARDEMIGRLAAIAEPAQYDPTGGDGYIRGTRDVIEGAVRDALLDEDDWNAIVEAAKEHPALLAIVPGE